MVLIHQSLLKMDKSSSHPQTPLPSCQLAYPQPCEVPLSRAINQVANRYISLYANTHKYVSPYQGLHHLTCRTFQPFSTFLVSRYSHIASRLHLFFPFAIRSLAGSKTLFDLYHTIHARSARNAESVQFELAIFQSSSKP
jgi:hypothetical protein